MTVKQDGGRREVELELELPGTPEQVWQAIATGPGISAWFAPTEVEEREGGAVKFQLGGGMESAGTVTAWKPHERFAYQEVDWSGDAPPLATEFTVVARAGGVCRVRLVHSLFTSEEDWDDQLESMERGWPPFFEVLRYYLLEFPGEPAATVRVIGPHAGTEPEAFAVLEGLLGLANLKAGQDWVASGASGAPELVGQVLRASRGPKYEVWLKLQAPAPGVALICSFSWEEQVQVALSLHLFGSGTAAIAAREEPGWQSWLNRHFAPASEAPGSAR